MKREMQAKDERIQIEWFACVHHKICSSLRKATYCET